MNIYKRLKSQKGAVPIVEAAFVYPIVIFVVIILFYFGNLLYQQSKMDAIAVRGAEYLAAIYTNPILMEKNIPTDCTQVSIKPYRYLIGNSEAEAKAKKYIQSLMNKTGSGFFSGMDMNGRVKMCKIKNYVVYQKACVQIDYSIKLLPMKFFDGLEIFQCSNGTTTAATDSAEFIRNVDMVMDYSEEFGVSQKINQFVGKFRGD